MARSNCRQRFRMSVSVPKRRPSIFGEWYTCINKEGKVRNHLKLLENLKRFIRGRNHDEPMAYYSSIETCNSDATSFFPHQKRPSLQLSSLLSKQWCGAPWSTASTNKLEQLFTPENSDALLRLEELVRKFNLSWFFYCDVSFDLPELILPLCHAQFAFPAETSHNQRSIR